MRYLCSHSTDFDEIWYDDAAYPSQSNEKPKTDPKKLKKTHALDFTCKYGD